MEDGVYLCKWKRTGDGFRLWVNRSPHIAVEGSAEVQVLSEQLSEAIAAAGGAQHAVLEFEKPFPKSAFDAHYAEPEIFAIHGDERFEIHQREVKWFDDYFCLPSCQVCKTQSFPRKKKSLTVDYLKTTCDGGFISCCGSSLSVFSDRFLARLTKSERNSLEFIPLHYEKRCNRKFHELIGPPGAGFAAPKGLTPMGWRCDTCGKKSFMYFDRKSDFRYFVAKSELPDPLPDVFTIGCSPHITLCMSADRWSELRGTPGTKGIVSKQIGVVPDHDMVPVDLPTQGEQARSHR